MTMHGNHRMAWLNPAHPEVRARFIGLVVETLKRCPMDGLQLDDHFAWPVQFGYDPFTVALYQRDTGSPPPMTTNRMWMTWRRRQLTGCCGSCGNVLRRQTFPPDQLVAGTVPSAYNLCFRTGNCGRLGELIDELVVQNYAYSVEDSPRSRPTGAAQSPQLAHPHPDWSPGGIRQTHHLDGRSGTQGSFGPERGHGVIFFTTGRPLGSPRDQQTWLEPGSETLQFLPTLVRSYDAAQWSKTRTFERNRIRCQRLRRLALTDSAIDRICGDLMIGSGDLRLGQPGSSIALERAIQNRR